jgi:hypothetical protein
VLDPRPDRCERPQGVVEVEGDGADGEAHRHILPWCSWLPRRVTQGLRPPRGRVTGMHQPLPAHAPRQPARASPVAHARAMPARARTPSHPRTGHRGPRAGKTCSSRGPRRCAHGPLRPMRPPARPARGQRPARMQAGVARGRAAVVRQWAMKGSSSPVASARRSRGRRYGGVGMARPLPWRCRILVPTPGVMRNASRYVLRNSRAI